MTTTTLRTSWLLVVGLLAGACTGDRAGGPADAPEWLSAPAAPVRLELALDTARARAKEVTPAGGVVAATGADGTRYVLRILRDALLSPEVITLTPAARVSGLPFVSDEFSTVHIEPSGLELLEPAMLTIRRPHEIAAEEQVAFGYTWAGEDAHLVPILPDAHGRARIPVLHFSGYGFGRAAPDDPGRLALQRAASYEARVSARLAVELGRARARQISGLDPADGSGTDWGELIVDPMIEYYDAVIRPLMQAAAGDYRMAVCAIGRYLRWERQNQLLGTGLDDATATPPPGSSRRLVEIQKRRAEGWKAFIELFEQAIEEHIAQAIRRCREEHDFTVLSTVFTLEREGQLLGIRDGSELGPEIEQAKACLTFVVEFRSVIEQKTPTGGSYHHVTAEVPYTMLADEPQTAPLEYVAFRASGNPMLDLFGGDPGATPGGAFFAQAEARTSAAGTKPGIARVFGVIFDLNPRSVEATDCSGGDIRVLRDYAENFQVTFAPGVPVEIVRHTYVHQGEQYAVAAAAQEFAEVMGDETTATAMESLRIGEPFTTEETWWAEQWATLHGDLAVNVAGAGDADDTGGAFRIALEATDQPGTWRVDLKQALPPAMGVSLSGSSYVILRHTPK